MSAFRSVLLTLAVAVSILVFAPGTQANASFAQDILAPQNGAEQLLLASAQSGTFADFRALPDEADRTVRAEFLLSILKANSGPQRPIRVIGAVIHGDLSTDQLEEIGPDV